MNWRDKRTRYTVDLPGGPGLAVGPATGQVQIQAVRAAQKRAEQAERERDVLARELAELKGERHG